MLVAGGAICETTQQRRPTLLQFAWRRFCFSYEPLFIPLQKIPHMRPLALSVTALLAVHFLPLLPHNAAAANAGPPPREQIIRNYVPILAAQYARVAQAAFDEALHSARDLDEAIKQFAAEPSEEHLAAARLAAGKARAACIQGEAFRFYGGPIDRALPQADLGTSLFGSKQAKAAVESVIADSAKYPELSPTLLSSLAEKSPETAMACYTAIDWLLRGDHTGEQSVLSDFTSETEGAASKSARRCQYLTAASGLLVQQLTAVTDEWKEDQPANYRSRFLALSTEEKLKDILTSLGVLSLHTAEFMERNSAIMTSLDSDGLARLVQGITDVFEGRYVSNYGDGTSGPGVYAITLQVSGSHPLHPSVGPGKVKAAFEQLKADANGLSEITNRANPQTFVSLRQTFKTFATEIATTGQTGLNIDFGKDSPLTAIARKPDSALDHAVIRNYADIVLATYEDSLNGAKDLRHALVTFVEKPSEKTLEAAKKAWLSARIPYSQSEVFRFYGGPIDGEGGPEGLINSWPIDEAYIDCVKDQPKSGIINDLAQFPSISPKLLEDLNEKDGETNISTGYHAIEFLLWGQDFNVNGPGQRPYTDYLEGGKGTAPNAKRRCEYLRTTADLLVQNLEWVVGQWAPGKKENYRARFVALPPKEALQKILTGMAMLGGVELSGERMMVAYDTQEQKEEQSCFSDNTHNDIIYNAQGIANLFYGEYKRTNGKLVSGPGIRRLAEENWDAEPVPFAAAMEKVLTDTRQIPPPFDQAILGDDSAPGRQKINESISSLMALADNIAAFGGKLGFQINLASLKDADD